MLSHFEPPVRDLHRLRRYTFWTIAGCGPFALFIALSFLAASELPGPRLAAAVVAAAAVTAVSTAALVVFMRDGSERAQRLLSWTGLAALVAGLALAYDGEVSAAWVAPAGLLASVPVLRARPGLRWKLALYGTVAVFVVAVGLTWTGLADRTLPIMSLMIFPAVVLGVVCQWWNYAVALELEHSRGLAAELAVAEERLRFAAELHDINGGHLQAIVLKAQLARRLVEVRPADAVRELEAIEELSRATLGDTRAVVGGYRQVSLADEIASAARILDSAGIHATVDADVPELGPERQRLLGLLVREGTTNLLRHAEATEATLRVEAEGGAATVAITNDGAGEESGSGNGLAMLAERFTAAGGAVEHAREGGRFVLTGSLPLEAGA
ncbi:sensor histidine kinase [Glycomyces tenuis]|uniref:sensor histidine kinase n=1 Tax=Glycomyces tenuis TaxID=58116 RepID=UPI0004082494|nr:histidine kinase [Glycomyces tenuis]